MTKKKQDNASDVPPIEEFVQRIDDLTSDLQRTRADFENYRKRVDTEKQFARTNGEIGMIMKLLPVIDSIDRAVAHAPSELADNKWAQGVTGLSKQLDKVLGGMNIKKINAAPGTVFNPELHEAIQVDEDSEGDSPDSEEVVAEELQSGYTLNGQVIRSAMVKVTRK